MIKFEDVPKSILRLALEAYAHASGLGILPDDEAEEDWDEDYLNGMQAAIAAAINAWPGMERHTFPETGSGDDYIPPIDEIFLPLPTENPDAEA